MEEKTSKKSAIDIWQESSKAEIVTIDLPSGAKVKIKKLEPFEIITSGIQPIELYKRFEKALAPSEDGSNKESEFNLAEFTDEDVIEIINKAELIAIAALVEPKAVKSQDNKDEAIQRGVVPVDMIPKADLLTIMVAALPDIANQSFFREQRSHSIPAHNSKNLRTKTESTFRYPG